jgi:uncharacterized protein (DUF1501 family)
MHLISTAQQHSRRAFLRRSAQLALTGSALPTALSLAAIGEAAAQTAPAGSYKALVCVFLYGGNDQANTIVNYDDASYNAYSRIRGGTSADAIALPKTSLLPLGATLNDTTRSYAMHPNMTGLQSLYGSGQLAIQLNVGPLIVPLNRTQYFADTPANPVPAKLFSHNDQASVWQSSAPEGATVGWGGNIGDLILGANTNSLFTCVSITGNTVFLAGDTALSYQVSQYGAVKIQGTEYNVYDSAAVKNAVTQLVQQASSHVLENEYNRITKRAIAAEIEISRGINAANAIDTNTNFKPLNDVSGNNPLAVQLRMVARLIAARQSLGNTRQVFFVSLGGFDLHDNLKGGHNNNMTRLSQAMSAFYQTTANLGVANDVTAFTASDFGRSLTTNGDGSDHGWGNHHMILGGSVKGNAMYGYAPPVGVGDTNSDIDRWHVGQGRLLPTTSVDQYAATLANWFGVALGADTEAILPNLRNFGGSANGINYAKNLQFMR